MTTAHLFIDYQNVHFTAWECFTSYGAPVYDSLIHPGKFADQISASRDARGFEHIDFTRISVYRGLPSRRHEPGQHARVQRQASQWTKDRRVVVNLRPLRYPRDWPDTPSQEKGVDVHLAIEVAQAAMERSADVLVVATRDTDIVPALELAQNVEGVDLELATWVGQSELKLSRKARVVRLDKGGYSRSRDMNNYR